MSPTRALLLCAASLLLARAAPAVRIRLDIAGTGFVGCPSAISCGSFPTMWEDTSAGQPFHASVTFDTEAPLAASTATEARYDHPLPLVAPLGIDITFGSYRFVAGPGTTLDRYSIRVTDSALAGDSVAIEAIPTPGAVTVPAPSAGFDALRLDAIVVEFLPDVGGIPTDLFSGTVIPAGFWELAWVERRIRVEVFDVAQDRAGTAFLDDFLSVTATVVPEPRVGPWLLLALAAVGWRARSSRH